MPRRSAARSALPGSGRGHRAATWPPLPAKPRTKPGTSYRGQGRRSALGSGTGWAPGPVWPRAQPVRLGARAKETIMEGEQFDALIRRALCDASRRGLVRAGIGALIASALTPLDFGLLEHAEA